MYSQHNTKVISILLSFILLIQAFVPFSYIPASTVNAPEQITTTISFNSDKNAFSLKTPTQKDISYALHYKTADKIDAILGSVKDQSGNSPELIAGTCSNQDCVKQKVIRGILKSQIDGQSIEMKKFIIEDKNLKIVNEQVSTGMELSEEEEKWLENGEQLWDYKSDTKTAILNEHVKLNTTYTAPMNNKVKITFTKLPEQAGTLSIKEITLTDEQKKAVNALSSIAYEITSSMTNGSFEYSLSLPTVDSKDLIVKYTDKVEHITNAQELKEKPEFKDGMVHFSGLNHFTVFVIAAAQDAVVDFSLEESNGSITVRWPEAAGSTGYKIYMANTAAGVASVTPITVNGCPQTGVNLINKCEYKITNLSNTVIKYIDIKSTSDGTDSEFTGNIKSATPFDIIIDDDGQFAQEGADTGYFTPYVDPDHMRQFSSERGIAPFKSNFLYDGVGEDKYDYRYDADRSTVSNLGIWQTGQALNGTYDIYVTYQTANGGSNDNSSATAVTYTVGANTNVPTPAPGSNLNVNINQRMNANGTIGATQKDAGWIKIGTYIFNNKLGVVTLSGNPSTGYIQLDAVAFQKVADITITPSITTTPTMTPSPTITVTPSASPSPTIIPCQQGVAWASSVENYTPGKLKNGANIHSNRINPSKALGANNAPDNGSNEGNFVSLGINPHGQLTLKFSYPIINRTGDDLSIYEVTNGRSNYPLENAKVEVSMNGTMWYELTERAGSVGSNVTSMDVSQNTSNSSISSFQYVRLTDETNLNTARNDGDGFDVDAIQGLEQVCTTPTPILSITPTASITPIISGTPSSTATFVKYICNNYSQVPANSFDGLGVDDTGGNANNLGPVSPASGIPVTNANSNPSECIVATTPWNFELYRTYDDLIAGTNRITTASTSTPLNLTQDMINEARNDGGGDWKLRGLWIKEQNQNGYTFGSLKCYNDHIDQDNADVVYFPTENDIQSFNCYAYNVPVQPTITPTATLTPTATPTATPTVHPIQATATFKKYICNNYSQVPANIFAGLGVDDTGGNAGNLGPVSPASGEAILDSNSNPNGCTEATTPWNFELYRTYDDLVANANSMAVASTTTPLTITEDMINEMTNDNGGDWRQRGLWIKEQTQSGYGFGSLKCYNDHIDQDNADVVYFPTRNDVTSFNCYAYNVPQITITPTVTPTVTPTLTVTPSPTPTVVASFTKYICPSYSQVPANIFAGLGVDDTGGNAGNLGPVSPATGEAVIASNSNPNGCTVATTPWNFELYGTYDDLIAGTNALATASTEESLTLTEEMINEARNDGGGDWRLRGLWIKEQTQAGYTFGSLKCFNDHIDQDNADVIHFPTDDDIESFNCYGYNVPVFTTTPTPTITVTPTPTTVATAPAQLIIRKTNNATTDKAPGDVVQFTIQVTAADADIDDVIVKDLPAEGFVPRNTRDWSVISSIRGNIDAATGNPNYASPGTWVAGKMKKGETVTITYTADISTSQEPGRYPDLAWAYGKTGLLSTEVRAQGTSSEYVNNNFVGTRVNVLRDQQSVANINVETEERRNETVTNNNNTVINNTTNGNGQVLGTSTGLPATGARTIWTLIAVFLTLIGSYSLKMGLSMLYSSHKKKRYIIAYGRNNVVRAVQTSFTAVLIAYTILFVAPSAHAATNDINVRLEEQRSPTTLTNFGLTFVTLDIQGRPLTAKCYKKGPSDSAYTQFGPEIAVKSGGNSTSCIVNSSVVSATGTYQFYVTAQAGSDLAQSNIIAIDYNTSGPGTPVNYNKSKTGSCEYTIKFKTADDSGKTARVDLYRSESTSFSTDPTNKVQSTLIGSNQEGTFTNGLPDCNKTYYYIIRAYDTAGNGSGTIGDSVVKVITTTTTVTNNTTTTNTTQNNSSGTSANVAATTASSGNGTTSTGQASSRNTTNDEDTPNNDTEPATDDEEVLGADDEQTASDEAEVLGETTSKNVTPTKAAKGEVKGTQSNNRVLRNVLLGILAAALLGASAYAFYQKQSLKRTKFQ